MGVEYIYCNKFAGWGKVSDSMENATYAGVIQDGQIRLDADVRLPEGSRVTVIGPTALDERSARRKANRWLVENVEARTGVD